MLHFFFISIVLIKKFFIRPQMSRFTVVMPVYNTPESYLREAVESVLAQTEGDWELVVIDDGSTRDVQSVVKSYDDERIRYIRQENRGLSGARNRGIGEAVGDYLLFLDADDKMADNLLATAARSLEKYGASDLMFFPVTSFSEKTGEMTTFDDLALAAGKDVIFPAEMKARLFDYCQTAWSKVFRRDFLLENNLFFQEGIIFEDTEFFFRYLCRADKILVLHGTTYFYRVDVQNSIIANKDRRHFDVLKVFAGVEKTLRDCGWFEAVKKDFYRSKIGCILWRFSEIDSRFRLAFGSLIAKEFRAMNLTRDDLAACDAKTRKAYFMMRRRGYKLRLLATAFRNLFYEKRKTKDFKFYRVLGLSFKKARKDNKGKDA